MDYRKILNPARVITLPKRRDRLEVFKKRYANATSGDYEVIPEYGFDGEKLTRPYGWKGSKGAFGCALAHLVAWAKAVTDPKWNLADDDPIAFFEDDAAFKENYELKLKLFASLVPDDWDILYLGGQHMRGGRKDPTVFKTDKGAVLLKCYNVNRLHAYVVKTKTAREILIPRILGYLTNAPVNEKTPSGNKEVDFDWEFGRMIETGVVTAYAVRPWLCGQGGLGSDTHPETSEKAREVRFWNV